MKITIILMLGLVTSLYSFAQDTISIEVIGTDTIYDVVQTQPHEKSSGSVSKQKQPKIKNNKIYYGGYANLSFGNYTAIGVEPLVGYKLTPKLSLGGKLSYEYIKDKRYSENYETSNYGFSIFNRFRITQGFYSHVEFSTMNYKLFYSDGSNRREWVPFLFIGGGISQPVTKNTWFNAEVLFDVLQDENSPYKDWEPFFSVGFGVGF